MFLDGEYITYEHADGTGDIISPSGKFSICGKDHGKGWENPNMHADACRVCIFNGVLSESDLLADMALVGALPINSSLLHFYDGTVENGLLVDKAGNWNLTQTDGCSILNETPWSTVTANEGGGILS